uniref:J domain-containing protein n=1 Tax=Pararhizobium sp. IMCC3301 TaxID=3067904 RepID=UPI00274291C4|nr:DnaJ family molecular chaperone [Pararhizobium sp. IMCC3301]
MGIFQTLQEWLESGVDVGGAFLDRITKAISGLTDPTARRQAAFSIAMIALSAKMAKADGIVTLDEIHAFRDLFEIPQAEQTNVARLFDLAKRDTAGFEAYAARIARLQEDDMQTLEDIMDGLFHIAKADGVLHEGERAFLLQVAQIFGFTDTAYEAIELRHVDRGKADPYRILGLSPDMDMEEMKQNYRKKVSEFHPDRMIARGVPPEFIAIANDRMAAINHAWEQITRMHRL